MRRMLLRSLALCTILFACVAAAVAQKRAPLSEEPAAPDKAPAQSPTVAQPPPNERPMTVKLMRLAEPGCGPDCPEWISAMGRIDETTPGEFRKALSKLGGRKLPVLIDSAGGTVDAGLAIGRMIRAKGLDVVVTKTASATCPHSDAECRMLKARGIEFGKPEPKISKCASSCAFILAGGVRRYVGPWTLVGLHQIKIIATKRLVQRHYRVERRVEYGVPVETRRSLVKEVTLATETKEREADEKLYERVRKYFVEMGISDAVMPILRSALNSSIHWMRVAELNSTGLATDFRNGAQLLTPQNAPAPPGSPQVVAPAVTSAPSTAPGTTARMTPALLPSPGAAPLPDCSAGGTGPSCLTTGSLATRAVSPDSGATAAGVRGAPVEVAPNALKAAEAASPATSAANAEAAPVAAAPANVTVTAAPASAAPVVEVPRAAPRATPQPAPPAKAVAPEPAKADAASAPIAPKPRAAARPRPQRDDGPRSSAFTSN